MEKKKKKINRSLIDVILLLIVALILSIPLFYSKLNVYTDDGIQHIARAFGTLNSLKENFFAPNIISSFANGFGYSWNLFYGPLSTYGIIIFSIISGKFISGYKIFAFFCILLSGLTMYKFVKTLTKINDIGLLAGILYMSFPYHLTDLYVRNAIGEFVSFIFIPLVFLGIYNIIFSEDECNKYYLAIGAIGLILTHNLSTAIVAIFALLYVILRFEKITSKEVLKYLFINILFIILITSFFWLPMLQTRLSADYQVYEEGMMGTTESVASHGLKLAQLFVTKDEGEYPFELGLNVVVMLVFSIIALRVIYKPLREHYIFFLILGILSMWMSTKYFPWKFLPSGCALIQFPWRMMMMTSFFISIVCSINMYVLIVKFNIKDVIVITVISLFCTSIIFSTFIMGDLGITDIENLMLGQFSGREYETVAGAGKGEYLPSKTYADKFYLATRDKDIYVLEGKAIITEEQKNNTNYSAKIQTFDAEYTSFELPYIYYPGYEVRIDGIPVKTFETENGLVGFYMGKDDNALIQVKYTGTPLMMKTFWVSLISLIVFAIVEIKTAKDLKNKQKKYIIEKLEKNNVEGENV